MPSLLLEIEKAKSETDPERRDNALQMLEGQVTGQLEQKPGDQELTDLLGTVRTYRSDARLQLEGSAHG